MPLYKFTFYDSNNNTHVVESEHSSMFMAGLASLRYAHVYGTCVEITQIRKSNVISYWPANNNVIKWLQQHNKRD